jgi:hypothetical protein
MKDNLQHIAGLLVGLTALRLTGLRFGKDARGSKWFSTVAANLAADREPVQIFPYAW